MKNQRKLSTLLVAIILAIALVAVNVLLLLAPTRITQRDMTMSNLYTVSEETQKLLAYLNEDVTLYVLNSDGSQTRLDVFLKRYSQYSDKLSVEYVNTEEDAGFLVSHGYESDIEFTPNSILVYSEKRAQLIDFYTLFYYSNEKLGAKEMSQSEYEYYYSIFSSSADYTEYLYSLAYDSVVHFNGDELITGAVEYVTVDEIPQLYFIEGHGEDSATDGNLAYLLTNVGYKYRIHDISKSEGIPSDASCIIINSPTSDYSEYETELVLDYLARGGHMLLLTNADNIGMTNLMSIAEYYGGTTESGYISEVSDDESDTEDGEKFTIAPSVNAEHDLFATFPSYPIEMKNATPITISGELRRSQLVSPILTTSDSAYIDDPEVKQIYTIGVAAEEIAEEGTAKMVWFTGSESFNAEEIGQNNLALLVYSIAWMSESYDSELGEIPAAVYESPLLTVSGSASMWLGVFIILLIPITIISCGIFVYVKRRKA